MCSVFSVTDATQLRGCRHKYSRLPSTPAVGPAYMAVKISASMAANLLALPCTSCMINAACSAYTPDLKFKAIARACFMHFFGIWATDRPNAIS